MPLYLRKHLNAVPLPLGGSGPAGAAPFSINAAGVSVRDGTAASFYQAYLSPPEYRADSFKSADTDDDESDAVEIFVDTGVSYGALLVEDERPEVVPPTLPSAWNRLALGLGVAVFAIAFGSTLESEVLLAALLALPFVAVGYGAVVRRRNRRVEELLDDALTAAREQGDAAPALAAVRNGGASGRAQRSWLHFHLYHVLIAASCLDSSAVTGEQLRRLETTMAIPEEARVLMKAEGFARITAMLLSDLLLEEEEEAALRDLLERLDLLEEDVEPELTAIDCMAELRRELNDPLEPMPCDVELENDELCYYQSVGRLLTTRVLNRFKSNDVPHREVGYAVEREGRVILTDRRLLLVNGEVRSYRLRRIECQELSLGDGTLRLRLDRGKNQVILALPDAQQFAARMERVLVGKQ